MSQQAPELSVSYQLAISDTPASAEVRNKLNAEMQAICVDISHGRSAFCSRGIYFNLIERPSIGNKYSKNSIEITFRDLNTVPVSHRILFFADIVESNDGPKLRCTRGIAFVGVDQGLVPILKEFPSKNFGDALVYYINAYKENIELIRRKLHSLRYIAPLLNLVEKRLHIKQEMIAKKPLLEP